MRSLRRRLRPVHAHGPVVAERCEWNPRAVRNRGCGHTWLNEVIAIGEGRIDAERGELAMRYYECTAGYLPQPSMAG